MNGEQFPPLQLQVVATRVAEEEVIEGEKAFGKGKRLDWCSMTGIISRGTTAAIILIDVSSLSAGAQHRTVLIEGSPALVTYGSGFNNRNYKTKGLPWRRRLYRSSPQ